MKTSREIQKELLQKLMTEGILINERCQMCGEESPLKCMTCLLNNRTACYHTNCHFENNHKPIWISVYE